MAVVVLMASPRLGDARVRVLVHWERRNLHRRSSGRASPS